MGLNTQQDPIGIAGGLNLYGYAGGDPINFSDPFGLCPFCPGGLLLAGAGGGGFMAGAAAGGAAGGGAGSLVPGVGTVIAGVVGALVGGAIVWSQQKKVVGNVESQLGVVADHLGRIGNLGPDDEDPDGKRRDWLNHAKNALDRARDALKPHRVGRRTLRRLEELLDDYARAIERIEGGN